MQPVEACIAIVLAIAGVALALWLVFAAIAALS